MGFLKSIGNAIARPVRGLGRIARGKFREGLHDIGSTAKLAAPVLGATGVGMPAAAGLGAIGGALKSGTRKDASLGSTIEGAAGGGAAGALGSLGHKLLAPGSAVAGGVVGPGGVSMPAVSTGGGGGLASIGGRIASWAKSNPELATTIVSTGANMAGAHQMGKAADREYDAIRADILRQQEREENMDPIAEMIIRRLMQPAASYR